MLLMVGHTMDTSSALICTWCTMPGRKRAHTTIIAFNAALKRSDQVAASEYRRIMDLFFRNDNDDEAVPTGNDSTSDDSNQAGHGPDGDDADGSVENGDATPTDGANDGDDSGTTTESLSDVSAASDEGDAIDRKNVENSQPGIAFYLKR